MNFDTTSIFSTLIPNVIIVLSKIVGRFIKNYKKNKKLLGWPVGHALSYERETD